MHVEFHDIIDRDDLKFSVIVSRDQNGNVFVRHRDRDTWEIPGGHIEDGETAMQAAERELKEETGANKYHINPVCDYAVVKENSKSFGRLFFADIEGYDVELRHEIGEVQSFESMPEDLTYPSIQPHLMHEVANRMDCKGIKIEA